MGNISDALNAYPSIVSQKLIINFFSINPAITFVLKVSSYFYNFYK